MNNGISAVNNRHSLWNAEISHEPREQRTVAESAPASQPDTPPDASRQTTHLPGSVQIGALHFKVGSVTTTLSGASRALLSDVLMNAAPEQYPQLDKDGVASYVAFSTDHGVKDLPVAVSVQLDSLKNIIGLSASFFTPGNAAGSGRNPTQLLVHFAPVTPPSFLASKPENSTFPAYSPRLTQSAPDAINPFNFDNSKTQNSVVNVPPSNVFLGQPEAASETDFYSETQRSANHEVSASEMFRSQPEATRSSEGITNNTSQTIPYSANERSHLENLFPPVKKTSASDSVLREELRKLSAGAQRQPMSQLKKQLRETYTFGNARIERIASHMENLFPPEKPTASNLTLREELLKHCVGADRIPLLHLKNQLRETYTFANVRFQKVVRELEREGRLKKFGPQS